VGNAIRRVVEAHPEWDGRIRVDIYGNTYPQSVVNRVLEAHGLTDIVHVHGRIPPSEVPARTQEADLLFLTLPDRVDGTPGGRISLKTYEYLMTDRPILATVPPGENRDFLRDKPGTYLTAPTDVEAMAEVISSLVAERFAGRTLSVERPGLQEAFSGAARAQALTSVLHDAIEAATSTSAIAVPVS